MCYPKDIKCSMIFVQLDTEVIWKLNKYFSNFIMYTPSLVFTLAYRVRAVFLYDKAFLLENCQTEKFLLENFLGKKKANCQN